MGICRLCKHRYFGSNFCVRLRKRVSSMDTEEWKEHITGSNIDTVYISGEIVDSCMDFERDLPSNLLPSEEQRDGVKWELNKDIPVSKDDSSRKKLEQELRLIKPDIKVRYLGEKRKDVNGKPKK